MPLPDYTTQDAATYKGNIDATAADHDDKLTPVEGDVDCSVAATSHSDTSIPSNANKIIITLFGLEVSNTAANLLLQFGDASAWLNNSMTYLSNGTATGVTMSSSSPIAGIYCLHSANSATATRIDGVVELDRVYGGGVSTNPTWVYRSTVRHPVSGDAFSASVLALSRQLLEN